MSLDYVELASHFWRFETEQLAQVHLSSAALAFWPSNRMLPAPSSRAALALALLAVLHWLTGAAAQRYATVVTSGAFRVGGSGKALRRLSQQHTQNYSYSCDTARSLPEATIRDCCSSNSLPANDDNSTAVTFPFNVTFFAAPSNRWYVNNNGNISPQKFGTYTPFPLIGHGSPVIAPFLADVDTRGAPGFGNVVTFGAGICTTGPPETSDTYANRTCWCANWVFSNFFCSNPPSLPGGGEPPPGVCQNTSVVRLNSFQVCLIDASSIPGFRDGDFDMEFSA